MNIFKTIGTVLLLASVSGTLRAACPDLTGDYNCGGYNISVSQNVGGDGVTTYTLLFKDSPEGDRRITVIADGMYRELENLRVSGSCETNNTLRVHTINNDKSDIRTTYSMATNGDLLQEGTFKYTDGFAASFAGACTPV